MKKYLFILIVLLTSICQASHAQKIGSWKLYLSYHNSIKNVVAGDMIYSVMDGNFLSYNTKDTEVRTYDTQNLLNDIKITHINYSKEAKKLIVVYENSNIDLIDEDDNVQNLGALKDKALTGKEINDVVIEGSMAYLATGFGFAVIDMKEGVFRNTYLLNIPANTIALTEDMVYLGTNEGVYICSRNANMQQKSNWKQHILYGQWKKLIWFNNKMVGCRTEYVATIEEKLDSVTRICDGRFNFMKETNGKLFFCENSAIVYTDNLTSLNIIQQQNEWSDISYLNGTYWVSEQSKGLSPYKIEGKTVEPSGSSIQPNSPIRNLAYQVSWAGNRLLVAGGVNTVGGISNPATSMYYEDGKWTNFEELDLSSTYKNIRLINTTNLIQDPEDDTHHFASLYRSGLVEYRNGKAVKLYNRDNSTLMSIMLLNWYNLVSCSGAQYDADGNIWVLNSMCDTIIHVMKKDGKWQTLYYDEISRVSLCDNYLFHSSGLKFLNSRRLEEQHGIFCFDTKGTLNTTRDDRHMLRTQIVNQDGTRYEPNEYYCLCEDLQGCVWVGTSEGLFVMEKPEDFFNENFQYTQVKINRNDGSGLADYLLNGVIIQCIAVDAANRKWIGTVGNGVYLISGDGQEMIHHFTTDNSLLLDNNINSIAVNHETGEVAFATESGLCSYLSDATEAEESLDKKNVLVFPNPIRSDYRGPITIRGLVMNTEVKILSSSGQLVWTGTSNGGTCSWNGCNRNGERVASGVYHVVANDEGGNKAIVTRIVVIK